ncbi:NACHT domain-containing protein [Nonomuraea maritima]|uniref:NACHT domain-containing protein n=1 Tax=Nonomuraea maritima TaxID=683260 RepID=A0A1G9RR72_9ACTN|nr:NACHT domain-containing protein [Nonomuraea maritima]SDM24975.1 NACHT domain-containing protein [Nonomuraea maritima]
MRPGRWWGFGGFAAATAAVVMAVVALPGSRPGGFDPVSATVALLALAVSVFSVQMAVRASRWQHRDVTAAAAHLLVDVLDEANTAHRHLLGDAGTEITVRFLLRPASAHNAAGAATGSDLSQVVDYYETLSPRRMVIAGAPGAGKTFLALELVRRLLRRRGPGDPVPVRLSAASLDTGQETATAVETWLLHHLQQVYGLPAESARALVAARMVTPVIDGLDELDRAERPGYASRAGQVLRAVNAYQDVSGAGAVVLTCRSTTLQALAGVHLWVRDAATVEIVPVTAAQAGRYLAGRAALPGRWAPVLARLRADPDGPLAEALSTPWQLTLAADVYEWRDPLADGFSRDPAELTGAGLDTPEAIRDHLLGLLVPAAVARLRPPGDVGPERVRRWLSELARHLNANLEAMPSLGGRVLSGTDIVPHELWPLAGRHRVRIAVAAACATLWSGLYALVVAVTLSAGGEVSLSRHPWLLVIPPVMVFLVWDGWRVVWHRPKDVNRRPLMTRAGRRRFAGQVGRTAGAGLVIGVCCGIFLEYAAGRGFAAGLAAGLGAGLPAGLALGFFLEPPVPRVRRPWEVLRTDVVLLLGSAACIGVTLGVALWLADGLALGGVMFVVSWLLVVPATGNLALRYVAFLLCTRRWNRRWLPWRLGRFLRWGYDAGLLRTAGIAYQFRHRELQDHLVRSP